MIEPEILAMRVQRVHRMMLAVIVVIVLWTAACVALLSGTDGRNNMGAAVLAGWWLMGCGVLGIALAMLVIWRVMLWWDSKPGPPEHDGR